MNAAQRERLQEYAVRAMERERGQAIMAAQDAIHAWRLKFPTVEMGAVEFWSLVELIATSMQAYRRAP